MFLGRMLFIFSNHWMWRLIHGVFDLPADHAYLLFKYMVVAEAPLAVVAVWAFVRELAGCVQTATIGALMVTLSPLFIIYSGQAMTEVPSMLLLAIALTVHLRGIRDQRPSLVLAGALLLGAAVNVREGMIFYSPWLVIGPLSYGRKLDTITIAACLLFLICALGPFVVYYSFDIGDFRAASQGWVDSTRIEAARHPVSLRSLWSLFLSFFVATPLVVMVLPLAAWVEWRRGGWSPLLAMASIGAVANAALVLHYSSVINARYALLGVAGTIPLVAGHLYRRELKRRESPQRAFQHSVGLVVVLAVIIGIPFLSRAWPTIESHAITREYRTRLAQLPDDAVIIAGGQTVSVTYYHGLGLGHWQTIGTGSSWPSRRLDAVIDGYLSAGHRVFVDADPRLWFNDAWRGDETEELVALGPRYRFRRLTETIYEMRPLSDEGAHDDPQLARLLLHVRGAADLSKSPRR